MRHLTRALRVISPLALSLALVARSQTAATDQSTEQTVVMDPFQVSSAGDQGYLAHSSLSGSRLNTSLDDIAAPTSAFTAAFLQDTAVRSVDELSLYMPGTTVTYPQGNQAFFANDSVELKIRGLPALNYGVNYFTTNLRLDLYNTDRVDESQGANSILFGLGSPGGVVNISTNRAVINADFGSFQIQPRSYNGLRASLDVNQEIIPDRLSLRVDAVSDHGGTWRYHEYDHQDRIYLAARWQPDAKTVVDVEFEHGAVNKSIDEPVTAADAYTIWANAGKALSATANASLGIVSLGATDHVVVDTSDGGLTQDWKGKMTTVTNTLEGNTAYLTDFNLLPQRAALAAGPAFPQLTNYARGDIFITRSLTPDWNVELAADGHDAPRDTINGASFNTLSADPNPTLPNGQPNPNAGKPYIEGYPIRNVYVDRSKSLRFTTSYSHSFGKIIGRQDLAALWENDWTNQGNLQMELMDTATPYSLASPENAANLIHYRTYLNLSGPPQDLVAGNWMAYPINQLADTTTAAGRNIGASWINAASGSALNRFNLDSGMAVLQSHFLDDRLVTVAGVRENWQDSWYSPTGVRGAATGGYVLGPYVIIPGSVDKPVRARNETLSGVLHVTHWFGLTYNWADDFALPSTTGSTPYGRVSAPTGRSQDAGIKIDFSRKLSLTASYFRTSDTHDYQASTILPSNPDASINTIWAALAAAGVSAPGGGSALNQEVTSNGYTYDGVTTGWEVELVANPVDNWRFYFNLTDSKSVDTNLGTESLQYFAQYQSFWLQGNNGRVLLDGSGGLAPVAVNPADVTPITVAEAVGQMQQLLNQYYVLGDGQEPRGQVPLQYNIRTDYAFDSGVLRGADVGGGLRYLGPQVVDYVQATSTSPVRTLYSSNDVLVDFNAGYERPARWLGRDFHWRVQLNINNLLDETKIIPMQVTSTDQTIVYHLQPPREYVVSFKVSY